jgi:hypothetical protein
MGLFQYLYGLLCSYEHKAFASARHQRRICAPNNCTHSQSVSPTAQHLYHVGRLTKDFMFRSRLNSLKLRSPGYEQ